MVPFNACRSSALPERATVVPVSLRGLHQISNHLSIIRMTSVCEIQLDCLPSGIIEVMASGSLKSYVEFKTDLSIGGGTTREARTQHNRSWRAPVAVGKLQQADRLCGFSVQGSFSLIVCFKYTPTRNLQTTTSDLQGFSCSPRIPLLVASHGPSPHSCLSTS
jgi:hypothetical protein